MLESAEGVTVWSMTQRLAPVDLAAALIDLPDLHRGPAGHVQIRLQAPSFAAAIELVDLVGATAEEPGVNR